MAIADCRIIDMPRIQDPRGNLTFVEGGQQIPFDIKRVYYLYDVPGGSERGGHAHLGLHQFVIAMSGSFDIVLDDGFEKKRIHLNRSYLGLYLPPMTWGVQYKYSSDAMLLVFASDHYDASDYIRDYGEFLALVRPDAAVGTSLIAS